VRHYPALDLTWLAHPDESHVEQLLAAIDDEGPTAVEDRPAGVRVFFSSVDARRRAAADIAAFDPAVRSEAIDVPDEDWAERSQADLAPITVGRLTVKMTPGEISPGEISPGVILIRASMGFGTGHHASTRLCLTLLQRIPLAGRRVLDIGTGSGILAIAAWRLGAASAVGIDHDPDALTAARESVELNRATTAVSLATADLAAGPLPGAPVDVVLANLTGALITREAAAIARAVAPHGHLIISGVMEDEEPTVAAALISVGLTIVDRDQEQEWIGAVFQRR
jgi:ribosomal protein L11 methyltransferase